MSAIPVAIVGASGYAGEGSLRLLLRHPHFTIVHVGSDRLPGTAIGEALPAFAHTCDLTLQPDSPQVIRESGAEVVVLAKKSPDITELVPELLESGMTVIDIGAEFRLHDHATYRAAHGDGHHCPELLSQAVYGLSEWHTEAIRTARLIGNPGCFPTSILLPLLPLLADGAIDLQAPLCCVSYSGLSGGGKRFNEGNNNLFYAINENLHSYKTTTHQHRAEIDQECSLAAGDTAHLHFIPHLAPLTQGILSTLTLRLAAGWDRERIYAAWQQRYSDRPFVRLRDTCQAVEVANVQHSNFCDFAAEIDGDTLIITSAVDNLVKGAAGQAVQNLNLRFGFDETTGLL